MVRCWRGGGASASGGWAEVPLVGPASWMRGVAGCAGRLGPLPSKWEESREEWLSSGAGAVECALVSERASSSLSRSVVTVVPPPTSTATPAAASRFEVTAPEAPAVPAAEVTLKPLVAETSAVVAPAVVLPGTADAACARAAVAADMMAVPPATTPKIRPVWCLLAALCA